MTTAGKPRRRSLKKEFLKVTVEGKSSRIHFIPKVSEVEAEFQDLKENPDVVKFGAITVGDVTLKVYAFKDQPNLVFFRINKEFIPLNRFKLRELVSLAMKGAWFVGLFGKRAKKYASSLQA